MAGRPFRYTAEDFINDPNGGEPRLISRRVIEIIPLEKGKYDSRVIEETSFMPAEEWESLQDKMMENVGREMSDYVSHHPESALWNYK